MEEERSVLGGAVQRDADPQWLCVRCRGEFRPRIAAEQSETFRLLSEINGELLASTSRLLTAGLAPEAKALDKSRRVVAERAEELGHKLGVERPAEALGLRVGRRGENWSQDETILAYALLKRSDSFPSEEDIGDLATYLGRSAGSVSRKLAILLATSRGLRRLRHGSRLDDEIVDRYAADNRLLRRDARRIRREWEDPLPQKREPSELRQLEYDFWRALVGLFEHEGTVIRIGRARHAPWYNVRIGRSGFYLSLAMDTRDKELACSLVIQRRSGKSAFEQLEADREELEEELGSLEWEKLPQRQRSRIGQRRPLALRDRESWPELLAWSKDRLESFHRAFMPRISAILL